MSLQVRVINTINAGNDRGRIKDLNINTNIYNINYCSKTVKNLN